MKHKNFLKDHGNQNIDFKDGYYISLNELYQAFEEERKEKQKEPECKHGWAGHTYVANYCQDCGEKLKKLKFECKHTYLSEHWGTCIYSNEYCRDCGKKL